MTPFTDAAAAIDEAIFLAKQTGKPYALVAVDAKTINVIPLTLTGGLIALEIVRP